MSFPVHGYPLDELTPQACGVVLAVALGGVAQAGDIQAQAAGAALVGPAAADCRGALAALAALPDVARAEALAHLRTRVTAPVPAGIERVHPGWLRAVLQGEAPEVLLAITAGLPPEVRKVAEEIIDARGQEADRGGVGDRAGDGDGDGEIGAPARLDAESLAELRRAVFAPLAHMPDPAVASRSGAPDWQHLTALSTDQLLAELARRGAETLGLSLAGAPATVLARAASRAGAPVAAAVLQAARRPPVGADRDRARALVARATAVAEATALGAAPAIGLVAVAETLASESGESVRAVAQRLPPALGRALLAAHAHARAIAARPAAP